MDNQSPPAIRLLVYGPPTWNHQSDPLYQSNVQSHVWILRHQGSDGFN